jgi:hypothetical protein
MLKNLVSLDKFADRHKDTPDRCETKPNKKNERAIRKAK